MFPWGKTTNLSIAVSALKKSQCSTRVQCHRISIHCYICKVLIVALGRCETCLSWLIYTVKTILNQINFNKSLYKCSCFVCFLTACLVSICIFHFFSFVHDEHNGLLSVYNKIKAGKNSTKHNYPTELNCMEESFSFKRQSWVQNIDNKIIHASLFDHLLWCPMNMWVSSFIPLR